MLDLLGIKQQASELMTGFLERFKRIKGKCRIQLPDAECAFIAVSNINPQLREKLIAS